MGWCFRKMHNQHKTQVIRVCWKESENLQITGRAQERLDGSGPLKSDCWRQYGGPWPHMQEEAIALIPNTEREAFSSILPGSGTSTSPAHLIMAPCYLKPTQSFPFHLESAADSLPWPAKSSWLCSCLASWRRCHRTRLCSLSCSLDGHLAAPHTPRVLSCLRSLARAVSTP